MSDSSYVLISIGEGTGFKNARRYKIIALLNQEKKKSRFCECSNKPQFNCGFLFPCTLEDYQKGSISMFIITDDSIVRKQKRVAKYTFSSSVSSNSPLFGPQLVPFLDVTKDSIVYCQVNMWIQYVTSKSPLNRFPGLDGDNYHPCALSLCMKSARSNEEGFVEDNSYCDAFQNSKFLGSTSGSSGGAWSYRFLIALDNINNSTTFHFFLHNDSKVLIGECNIRIHDIISDQCINHDFFVYKNGRKTAHLFVDSQLIRHQHCLVATDAADNSKNPRGFFPRAITSALFSKPTANSKPRLSTRRVSRLRFKEEVTEQPFDSTLATAELLQEPSMQPTLSPLNKTTVGTPLLRLRKMEAEKETEVNQQQEMVFTFEGNDEVSDSEADVWNDENGSISVSPRNQSPDVIASSLVESDASSVRPPPPSTVKKVGSPQSTRSPPPPTTRRRSMMNVDDSPVVLNSAIEIQGL